MLLTKYDIRVSGVLFSLIFKDNLVLVDGKSGLGKTMLFKQIKKDALVNNRNFLCLDYNDLQTNNVANVIGKVKSKVIFIDNAEIVLNDMQRTAISFDTANQYVIFTHNTRGYKPNRLSFATLEIKGNQGYLSYDLQ